VVLFFGFDLFGGGVEKSVTLIENKLKLRRIKIKT